jgi:beta-fructofuranosidase
MAQDDGSAMVEAKLAADPMRPQFHLLPARNWMNDPNGPIYYKGKYHMFFQYDPLAAVWGDMSWNHAVSSDMLHWSHLPVALTPTPDSPDAFGVFSGSALAVREGERERVYAVYTGTKKSSDALATIRDGANNIQESQCLAYSDDARLVRWMKLPEPIVPRPPEGMKITGFRDPSAWRQGDWYYMTVGSGVEGVGGCVLLYRSKVGGDLKTWEYLHTLTGGEWNGRKTANPCDDGEMWECPEFFALGDLSNGGAHVLIYSTLGKVFWQSGVLDEATMKFTAKKTGLLDFDAFYAPKTQLDAEGRRILWGWIPERRDEAAMKAAGWSGMMSLPRVMSLDEDGTLRVKVLPGVSALRDRKIASEGGKVVLPKATGEVLCVGEADKDFSFSMSGGEAELMTVNYSAENHSFNANGKVIALQPGDAPTLHAFVDGSVIELILGERIGYTKRFYYTSAAAPDIVVSAHGGPVKIDAWKVAPISDNRLTTPARV